MDSPLEAAASLELKTSASALNHSSGIVADPPGVTKDASNKTRISSLLDMSRSVTVSVFKPSSQTKPEVTSDPPTSNPKSPETSVGSPRTDERSKTN